MSTYLIRFNLGTSVVGNELSYYVFSLLRNFCYLTVAFSSFLLSDFFTLFSLMWTYDLRFSVSSFVLSPICTSLSVLPGVLFGLLPHAYPTSSASFDWVIQPTKILYRINITLKTISIHLLGWDFLISIWIPNVPTKMHQVYYFDKIYF